MRKIILASGSARRKELLTQIIGNDFELCVSSYDEAHVSGLTAEELVKYHSAEKARDISRKFSDAIIISADTVIVFNSEILGKPDSQEHARSMLKMLSGQKVQAITGISLVDIKAERIVTESETTDIWMKEISENEIEAYLCTGEPFGKAGSFAIQGKGALFVEKIEGDYFNIVGLPLFRLGRMLENMNITFFS